MAEAEIITRRRKWSAEEKAALLSEVDAEGGRVAMVARRHGLSESLLYNWRSVAQAAADRDGPEPIEFVPVGVIDRASEVRPVLLTAPEHPSSANGHQDDRVGEIEIQLPNGVRIRVNALVNEKALSRVFRALKGAV
ncbi:MAG: IS66-like element accessory protein TnpA [Steroidobacteraceae bacterium]